MQNFGGQIRCIIGNVQVAKMLQVKIIFRVKFFNLGWFSIFFVSILALIHEQLGLGDKGKWELT